MRAQRPALLPKLSEAVAGGSLALTRLRGSPVVLHVWSSACGPCRSDARLIETTWQRWGRRGVAFVGLSVDESEAAAARFAREYGLSYPIVRDPGGRVADAFGVTTLPETFFISSTGDIVGSVAGSPSVGQMEQGTAGRPHGAHRSAASREAAASRCADVSIKRLKSSRCRGNAGCKRPGAGNARSRFAGLSCGLLVRG